MILRKRGSGGCSWEGVAGEGLEVGVSASTAPLQERALLSLPSEPSVIVPREGIEQGENRIYSRFLASTDISWYF